MIQLDFISLGILLTVTGLFFFGIVMVMVRGVVLMRPNYQPVLPVAGELLPEHEDAVLMVENGGRIHWMNPRARQIFQIPEGEIPTLERLVRRTRPTDILLKLCAAEGQARFVVDGRLIEGTSYQVVDEDRVRMLVSLRFPELATAGTKTGGISAQTLQTFTQLTQEMAASLELEPTIRAILSNIEKLVPAELMEVTIWDPESETFIPYRYTGLPGLDRKLELLNTRYSVQNSFAGRLYETRAPLLIPDLTADSDLQAIAERLAMPLRSYLGFPLLVGNEFIGTLEFGSLNTESFREEDQALVRMMSGQAAIAIHNALLYEEEQRRTAELSGLAQLVQAFSSVREPAALFARLVDSIKPLVKVEVLGFLMYNENSRVLEAKVPFHGLPNQVVELYRADILPGSPAEQLLISQDVLLTENASEDEKWQMLGLINIAQAASLRETALLPLATGGHILGYLQASNHTDGSTAFSQSEIHLLTIVANQSASIIENVALVQQARQRAQRAEALRRLASLASSAATLDEILQYSLNELGRLLRADVAAVFLTNNERSLLELHESSVFSSSAPMPERMAHLRLDDPQFHFTVTGSQHVLTSGRVAAQSKPIVPFYQALIDHWRLESYIVVPLVVRSEGIGELWFGSSQAEFFDQADVQVVATAAGQLAGVVEQSVLISQTDDSLRRRVEQMTAITRISRELSTSLDLEYLLQLMYDEALRTTKADCGTILLFDLMGSSEVGERLSIRFYVGDPPGPALSDLECRVLEENSAQIVPDFGRTEYQRPHAEVQSMLAVPIAYQQRHAGLILLHGRAPNQFDATALEITQSLAIQAAVALNNALAFEEQKRSSALLKRELETLSRLIEVTRTVRPDHSLQHALNAIAAAIQSATPFDTVLISVYDPAIDALRRTAGVGLPAEAWEQLRAHTQPWQAIEQLLREEFRVGDAYYIPDSKVPTIPDDVYVVDVQPAFQNGKPRGPEAWNPKDMLLVPLRDSNAAPLGLISVDCPRDNRQPDRPTFEALELFAAHASMMVESYRRAEYLEEELAELEAEKTRLELAARQAQNNLPMLLRKELEQSIALRGLNQRIDRVRATVEIAAEATRHESSEAILRTLASELVTRFAMQVGLVAERNASGVRLKDFVGVFPPGTNPEALFGLRNPLRQMLQAGRSGEDGLVLVSSLDNHPEWQNITLLNVLEARSMIGLTLDLGNDEMVGVLAIGQRTLPPFIEEDRRVFAQLARQVSVALQNLLLLTEMRRRLQEVNLLLDFSRKLGSLEPKEIFTALVESIAQVIPNADTCWIGMWEENDLAIVPQAAVGYQSLPDILGIRYWLQTPAGEVMDTRVVLPLRVFRTGNSERVAELNFATQYHLSTEDLQRYRRASGGRLPISVMLIPLRIGDNVLGVLCLENFRTQGAFTEEDEDLASSFTRQAAMALENARLYQASEQRATQLQALTMAAGTITSSLQSDELIALLLDQLKLVVPYDTATLWLRQGDTLTVLAARGFADNDSRLNISAAVEDSVLFRTMIQTMEAISVHDVRNDPRFPSLLEPENLSWLGIPLIYKSAVIGLIALEKREPDFYSTEIIQAATTFAGQAAVALENARLFEEAQRRTAELDERSQRLALLNRLSGELVTSLDVDHIFKLAGQQLVSALDAAGVAAILVNQDGKNIVQVEAPSSHDPLPMILPETPLFERLAESRGIFLTDNVGAERELAPLMKMFFKPRKVQSVLVVPLTAGSALQGWFMLYTTRRYRYSSSETELALTICNQAAIAIQNARLFAETRRLTEDLERRVEERTRELRREHQNSQTLLHIITELSTSLDMGLVLNRTLTVLNESVGAEESIIILSQGSVMHYRAGLPLSRLQDTAFGMPVERQIARWVIRSRKPVVIARVQDDPRWEISAESGPSYQSVLAVPLVMGEEVLGALELFHRQAGFFNQDQISLMEATARQIGIALNNAELFNLIRDQSEHLGSMLREQQIEASRSRAILEAVADGVLVTDAQGQINLFNASAERILGLKANQVTGKSLDQFVGLFGKTTADWIETIRNWSHDPVTYKNGSSYAEQIELDNGRIAAVHLAPVFWRQEFLGTVSIFRDITHEVQVDRLKSEFVANVSHELRTPMTSIKGYVEIMLMGASGELNPQQTHFLKIVKSNTERLSVLVNDLLDVSRIEAGRLTLNLQPLDMQEIAKDVITDIQRRAKDENRAITFTLEIPKGLPFARGDTERVRQVLGNLVSNGYNYTPDGGWVKVRITEVGREIQVDVQDNGIGIDPKEQHRIFERFYRGEDPLVLATAGFGLGLAIARNLVEMHQGRMWFSSSGVRGEGSTFSFTLPVYENEE